jgi:hypothetical protein
VRVLDDPRLALANLTPPDSALEVTTPWDRREEALAVLRQLSRPRGVLGCVQLEKVAATSTDVVPLVISSVSDEHLAIGSWSGVTYGSERAVLPNPIALAGGGDGAIGVVHILTKEADHVVWDVAKHEQTLIPRPATPTLTPPIGLGCAAFLDGGWWVVDPVRGRLIASDPALWRPPDGRWIGIARDRAGRLVLGAADQTVHVYDLAIRREVARFPATVPPSVRVLFGECTPIVTGDDWIATFDHLRSRLWVYDARGVPLRVLRLDQLLELPTHGISALDGLGSDLAVATGSAHQIWKLRVQTAGCSPIAGIGGE